ncbi:pseudouridine synthase [Astrocystis sublimbata]|nr:pseudouridine synthase [Astrocystis sublimbata]
MATHTAMAQGSNASMRSSLEQRLGIVHFVSTREHGWSGQSRTRYTDFQVNEITKYGEVVHLKDFYSNSGDIARSASQTASLPSSSQKSLPSSELAGPADEGTTTANTQVEATGETANMQLEEQPSDGISESDKSALTDLMGQTTTDELIAFYTTTQQDAQSAPKSPGYVLIPTIGDKSRRSRVHGEIRRIFGGKIETTTSSDDSIKATALRGGRRQRNNRSGNTGARSGRQIPTQGSNGPYLHFSLYKENKDTMDALNYIARVVKTLPKAFGAAGTKDRRAVTVQRVSVKGRSPASIVVVNDRINGIKIGDFKYAQGPIRLNDHDGNEFVIVLKNCVFSGTENMNLEETLNVAKSTIDSAIKQLYEHGFINYYGTQRFGTHQIGTQEVGMKILQEDFAGAVEALLSYDPSILEDASKDQDRPRDHRSEDMNRARACSTFMKTKNAKAALDHLPPRCHVEKTIIQHLGKRSTDFIGALMSINRSMRTMYGHAYQSLVWNFVASKRWERFGAQVIVGDLVLVKSHATTVSHSNGNGEDTEEPWVGAEDVATAQQTGCVPHAVTEDDLQAGKYSIFDVVLPSPGWDVVYPSNEIGAYYLEFMSQPENGGLDPYNMRRRQRDFSLPGSYRKLMGKLKRVPTASVETYSNDLQQLVPTDLDMILDRKAKESTERDARQQRVATSWNTFTQNVHENEIVESRTRAAQRKFDDPILPARINETWVETSVDGTNKRIKIGRHADVNTDKAGSVGAISEDMMQVEDISQGDHPAEINAKAALINSQDRARGTNDQQAAHERLGPSVIAAVAAQPTHQDTQSKPHGSLPQPGSIDEVTTTDSANNALEQNPVPDKPHSGTNTDSITHLPKPHLSDNGYDLQSTPTPVIPNSNLATDALKSTEVGKNVSADPKDEKIAVVLRFALDTSQYATIVVRELQGAFVTDTGSA